MVRSRAGSICSGSRAKHVDAWGGALTNIAWFGVATPSRGDGTRRVRTGVSPRSGEPPVARHRRYEQLLTRAVRSIVCNLEVAHVDH